MEKATEAGVLLRLIGGVAVWVQCPSAADPLLARSYRDVDLVGMATQRRPLQALMEGLGYLADVRLNALHGGTASSSGTPTTSARWTCSWTGSKCATRSSSAHASLEPVTVPLSDLLLTKLQVMQTNEKDYKDILALLVDHPLVEDDRPGIDLGRIARLAGEDWGLWRRVTEVAKRAEAFAASLGRPLPGSHMVQDQVPLR